jgi:LysR family hydrogen peroxide-inducible transcriptional activator
MIFRPVEGEAGHRRIGLVWRRGTGDADATALARVCRDAVPPEVRPIES